MTFQQGIEEGCYRSIEKYRILGAPFRDLFKFNVNGKTGTAISIDIRDDMASVLK